MDDEWWNDCIHTGSTFGGRHISTDDGYYPGSRLDQNIESETVTENNYDNVNQEDDSDAPSRNQNDSPSSYNHRSKRVYGNTLRSSSSTSKDNKLECAVASLQTLPSLQYDSSLYWGAVTMLQTNEKHEAFYRILEDDEAEDGSINFGESFIDPYSVSIERKHMNLGLERRRRYVYELIHDSDSDEDEEHIKVMHTIWKSFKIKFLHLYGIHDNFILYLQKNDSQLPKVSVTTWLTMQSKEMPTQLYESFVLFISITTAPFSHLLLLQFHMKEIDSDN
ncbi:hypothetical protein YC2023_059917 [Brassica napus]